MKRILHRYLNTACFYSVEYLQRSLTYTNDGLHLTSMPLVHSFSLPGSHSSAFLSCARPSFDLEQKPASTDPSPNRS